MGEKIRTALEKAGLSAADVASHFHISRQAVNSWIKTGRIGKDKWLELVILVRNKVSPEHWGDDASLAELAQGAVSRIPHRTARRPAWPFSTNEEAVCRLPPHLLEAIDAQLALHVRNHLPTERRRRAQQK